MLRIERKTNYELSTYVPLQGELIYNTDKKVLCVGDEVTLGGLVVGGSGGSLPVASTTRLGGVKVDGLTISVNSDGVISVSNSSGYILPVASTVSLGGVKVDGTTISINSSGVISTTGGTYTLPMASQTTLGGVKVGSGLSLNPLTGALSATGYDLPKAGTGSSGALGGVKVDGTTITINSSTGVISATGGAGGTYTLPTASASTLGGVKVGAGLTVDGNGVLGLRDFLNVKDYGAVGNGTTDDTTSIQNAINAAKLAGGKNVYFPPGSYLVSSTINVNGNNIYLIGSGWNTVIVRTGNFGDTFRFFGDVNNGGYLLDVGISDMCIMSNGSTSSGAHVSGYGVARLKAKNLSLYNGHIGFKLNGVVASYISNIYLVFTDLYGGTAVGKRYMEFGNAPDFPHPSCGDVFVTDFNLRGNTSNQNTEYGINIISADGIWFENGHVGNTTTANIHINGNTTEMLNLLFFSNVMTDEGTGAGVLFEGNASTDYRTITFTNCTFKSGGTPALATKGIATNATCNCTGVMFDNCTVTEFGQTGVDIQSTNFRNVHFNGCNVRGNGRNISSPGYKFASGTRDITVTGGSSGRSFYDAGNGSHNFGMQFEGNHTNINIIGVDLTGNFLGSTTSVDGSARLVECLTQDSAVLTSTSNLVIPDTGEVFKVYGSTQIDDIRASYTGRRVTLTFDEAITITNSGNKSLYGNFNAQSGDSLSLIFDGSKWQETSRSKYTMSGPSLVNVTGTSQIAVPGYHYVIEGASSTTITLPSGTTGDIIWITVANSRTDNLINVTTNTTSINGDTNNYTINNAYATIQLKHCGAVSKWRIM